LNWRLNTASEGWAGRTGEIASAPKMTVGIKNRTCDATWVIYTILLYGTRLHALSVERAADGLSLLDCC